MAFPLVSTVDLTSWTVGELATSAKGQRSAPIFAKSAPSPAVQLTTVDKPLTSPFGCNAYNDPEGKSTRRNLELNLSDSIAEKLSEIDAWAEGQATKLGLKGEYKPLVTPSKMGEPRLRCKVSCAGPSAARFWSTLREPLGNPMQLDLAGASVIPVVAFTKLWTMAGMYGVTAELRHCMVSMSANEAPDFC